jgi:hypothetical protein
MIRGTKKEEKQAEVMTVIKRVRMKVKGSQRTQPARRTEDSSNSNSQES